MLAALLFSLISALIDVPFLAQTPDLCGGAAVAMVMRYWGTRDVFPQDFARLVNKSEAGIPTGALSSAVRDRGWQVIDISETEAAGRADIRAHMGAGRPVIALIAVAARTYHYVVIVGATDDDIVVHDPALAPYRVLRWTEFDRAWAATDRWMMLMLPPPGGAAAVEPRESRESGPPRPAETAAGGLTPCAALVDRGVQLAIDGDAGAAEHALIAAMALCPSDPAPRRELAGLRFSQTKWPEARRLALEAVRLAPADLYSWNLAGSSAYVGGDTTAALVAWNHAGAPHVDTIDIQGAIRTPQPVVVRAAGLEPRALLTPALFARAERRLRALPIAASTRLAYTPIDGGAATMKVFIDERPARPRGWWAAGALAAHALLYSELRVDVAGPLRAGDVEHAAWRWSSRRPRVDIGLSMPSPRGVPGVMSFDASWEQETHNAAPSLEPMLIERNSRRRAGLRFSDWSTGWLHWSTGAALDRFNTRQYVAADSGLDVRLKNDRVAMSVSGEWWIPLKTGSALTTASVVAALRSTRDSTRSSVSSRTEVTTTSDAAPIALWPGAGTGRGRDLLLRAHPLLHDDVIAGPVFGRTVLQSSAEYARPLNTLAPGLISAAVFVDAARAWRRLSLLDMPERLAPLSASPLYIDAGIGLRLHAPGQPREMRIDLAHGLRGGGFTLSAGWTLGWPR